MDAPTAQLAAVLAVTLGLVEALKLAIKALIAKRNGGNNPSSARCKYDPVLAGRHDERLERILECVQDIEKLLRERE